MQHQDKKRHLEDEVEDHEVKKLKVQLLSRLIVAHAHGSPDTPSQRLTLDQLPQEILESVLTRVPFDPEHFRAMRLVCSKFLATITPESRAQLSKFLQKTAQQSFPEILRCSLPSNTMSFSQICRLHKSDCDIKFIIDTVAAQMTDGQIEAESEHWQNILHQGLLILHFFEEVSSDNRLRLLMDPEGYPEYAGLVTRPVCWLVQEEPFVDFCLLIRYMSMRIAHCLVESFESVKNDIVHDGDDPRRDWVHWELDQPIYELCPPLSALVNFLQDAREEYHSLKRNNGHLEALETVYEYEVVGEWTRQTRMINGLPDLVDLHSMPNIESWLTEPGQSTTQCLLKKLLEAENITGDYNIVNYLSAHPCFRMGWSMYRPLTSHEIWIIESVRRNEPVPPHQLVGFVIHVNLQGILAAELQRAGSKLRQSMPDCEMVLSEAVTRLRLWYEEQVAAESEQS